MPISFDCDECGKSYRVKEEAAGKKFRCKDCNAPLQVPKDEFLGDVGEDDWEDYGDGGYDDGGYDDYEDEPERPRRPRSSSKSRKRPKKRKRKKSKGGGAAAGKILLIIGGVFGVIVVGGGLIAVIGVASKAMNPDWKPFSPPLASISALMPGTPKTKNNMVGMVTEYNYIADTRRYACNLTYVNIPPGAVMDAQAAYAGARQGKLRSHPGMRVVGERDITHLGQTGHEFEFENNELHLFVRVFILSDIVCGQEFITKKGSPRPDEREKFFNSLKFGRHAGSATPG